MANDSSIPGSPSQPSDGSSSDSALGRFTSGFLRKFGLTRLNEDTLRDSLEEIIEQEDQSGKAAFDREERAILSNILTLDELDVEDIRVPRVDIIGVDVSASLTQIVNIFQKEAHSRMPVYRDGLDDILGMVHIKDVFAYWGEDKPFKLRDVLREVLFVPQTMPVMDLLQMMRKRRIHMAIVVDEYGGTDGLVTIENLVEQIVGDIEDEHDEEESLMVDLGDGTLDVDARLTVGQLEEKLGVDLLPEEEDEEIDTLGGIIFTLLGRVPEQGEVISHPSGINFEITAADPRRIRRVLISGLSEQGSNELV